LYIGEVNMRRGRTRKTIGLYEMRILGDKCSAWTVPVWKGSDTFPISKMSR